jgi:hypothetical protein
MYCLIIFISTSSDPANFRYRETLNSRGDIDHGGQALVLLDDDAVLLLVNVVLKVRRRYPFGVGGMAFLGGFFSAMGLRSASAFSTTLFLWRL